MKVVFLIQIFFIPVISFSQLDTSFIAKLKALENANTLKFDTLSVPDDILTKKIKLLRNERNGLTTETVLKIKILEEQEKDTMHSKEFYKELMAEVTNGKTSQLIDNILINLYRRSFTEKEIDDLIVFYKTSAGKKMDKEFILLMLQSIKGAEQLLKLAVKNLEQKKMN